MRFQSITPLPTSVISFIESPKSCSPAAVTEGTLVTSFTCTSGKRPDRKSTRLNSSHGSISYAVFCLKEKGLLGAENVVHSDQVLLEIALGSIEVVVQRVLSVADVANAAGLDNVQMTIIEWLVRR